MNSLPASAHKTLFVDFLIVSFSSNFLVLLLVPFSEMEDKFPDSDMVLVSTLALFSFCFGRNTSDKAVFEINERASR